MAMTTVAIVKGEYPVAIAMTTVAIVQEEYLVAMTTVATV